MKKILTATAFTLLMFSAKVFAQNNITWVLNDKVENGYFKNKTEITSSFSGFGSASEASTFFEKLKLNPNISSVTTKGKDAKGNYLATFVVKEAHTGKYYVEMMNKMGVTDVEMNGEKKSATSLMAGAHDEERHSHDHK